MKKLSILLILCLIITCLTGCGQKIEENPDDSHSDTDVIIDNSIEVIEPFNIENIQSFYTASNVDEYSGRPLIYENSAATKAFELYRKFAIDCFKKSITTGENEIMSPFSFYYSLAMLANGADSKTKDQLQTLLGMTVEDLNMFLGELDKYYSNESFDKANALWINTNPAFGSPPKQSYIDLVNTYYDAMIGKENFQENTDKLVNDVNSWVTNKTGNKITEILSTDDIEQNSYIIFLNALTTGGFWDLPFDSMKTTKESFTALDGTKTDVDMMHQTIQGYWHTENATGIVKALDSYGVSFVAILPNEGIDIYDYINQMNANTIMDLINSEQYEDIIETKTETYEGGSYEYDIVDQYFTNISLPKFSYNKNYDLIETLKNFGLSDLLDPSTCDFSKISDSVYVQKAIQKATVTVDEEKATAAAVTMIIGGKGAAGPQVRNTYVYDVVFDRPFIFAFVTKDMPLFIGVVTNIENVETQSFQIKNITGTINIRSYPSVYSEIVGSFTLDQVLTAYDSVRAEGYTWYKIGENQWVADQNNEWIEIIR